MTPIAFMMGGPWDIAIVGGVILLLFGGSKLAGFGKNLGEGIKEFKKATHDEDADASSSPVVTPSAPTTTVVSAGKTEEK